MNLIRRFLRDELPLFFSAPALIWQGLFLYLPLAVMIVFSFLYFSSEGVFFTLNHYIRIFKPVYLGVILNSFSLASITCALTLVIGYPLAYFLALKVERFKIFFLFLIILPSWTNFIIQIYAWFFLLDSHGVINQTLIYLGVLSKPFHLLNTFYATIIGMVYCYLPFMVLPLYSSLEKMDKKLLEASADLGANKVTTFKKVVFPLSMPGVYAGFMLVFISSFGEYAIPNLLGGAKRIYWGSVIVDKFLVVRDWPSGFAFAWSGIVFIILATLVAASFSWIYRKING